MTDMEMSSRNTIFWDELCGSGLAEHLGIHDDSPESLKKFDDWYFDFYPYLSDHIPFDRVKDKDVLEVGLGYGSVTQRIAEMGARYHGLDIAHGPAQMAKHRLALISVEGRAVQGDILSPPFEPESFDYIVAIGCLHHSGDMRRSIENCYALLRPAGRLVFMSYYAYSYRRWCFSPGVTLRYALRELGGYRGVIGESNELERGAYDRNLKGEAAPYTVWISVRSAREYCQEFASFAYQFENCNTLHSLIPRNWIIKSFVPRLVGLDLYVTAIK